MNTTTFTIESVHGIKQTFVLGVSERSGSGQPCEELPGEMQSKPENGVTQRAPRATR